jgi:hypothetical protein
LNQRKYEESLTDIGLVIDVAFQKTLSYRLAKREKKRETHTYIYIHAIHIPFPFLLVYCDARVDPPKPNFARIAKKVIASRLEIN